MKLDDAQKVLESLKELSVDVEYFSWGPSYEFAKDRQKKAISIMKKYIKTLEETQNNNKLRKKYGVGHLDSLEICPECGKLSLVTYMAGGMECKECDYSEIAF